MYLLFQIPPSVSVEIDFLFSRFTAHNVFTDGNLGVSPASTASITGFSLVEDSSGTFSTSSQVTGHVFGASDAPPTPAVLTTAVVDMQTAYTDAMGLSCFLTVK